MQNVNKASSRLARRVPKPVPVTLEARSAKNPIGTKATPAPEWQTLGLGWLKNYAFYLQWLVGGIFCLILTYLLMLNVTPSSIANFILPDAYLPFQTLVAVGVFSGATFLWQSQRRGLITMVWLSLLLFFNLQKVVLTWWMILIWSLLAVVFLSLTFISDGKSKKHKIEPGKTDETVI